MTLTYRVDSVEDDKRHYGAQLYHLSRPPETVGAMPHRVDVTTNDPAWTAHVGLGTLVTVTIEEAAGA
jgi:hypothetical protein